MSENLYDIDSAMNMIKEEIIRELNDPNYYGEGKPSENWRPQHQLKDGVKYSLTD